jgi:sugar (pentulose or hexulose) kinase
MMKAESAIAIFDIGKTNKKIVVLDEDYNVLHRESVRLKETCDEDGYPCENIQHLTNWVKESFQQLLSDERFDIQALNFSAYGASLVYVDENLEPVLPLYNYLKPYPTEIQHIFYSKYQGEDEFSKRTATPVLGSLNSGLQLFRVKMERPETLQSIKYALHLPQYLSSILTGHAYADITSIGCHTGLWDFQKNNYHHWLASECLAPKFAPILPAEHTFTIVYHGKQMQVGIGMHDSSAALIPYLMNFQDPFILLSTGTWCISLNPFNAQPLTSVDLNNNCLCYLTYDGRPVKASRIFAGNDHETQSQLLSRLYNHPLDYFTQLQYSPQILRRAAFIDQVHQFRSSEQIEYGELNLRKFQECEAAYHQLIIDIVAKQLISTTLVRTTPEAKRIFIDGGFSRNDIYMNLMAAVFPKTEIFASTVAETSSIGAALAIHNCWNAKPIRSDLIQLKFYPDATRKHE